jgi:hypothetical protein
MTSDTGDFLDLERGRWRRAAQAVCFVEHAIVDS